MAPIQPTPELRQQDIIEPEELLNNLLESAKQLLPCDFGVLALWDAEAEALVPFYARVQAANFSDMEMPPVLRLGEGIIGYVAQTRQPLNVADVSANPHYREIDQQVRSELAVPVLHNNRLLGVFDVESRQLNAYRPEHVRVLQALAAQAALVIETARLYNSLRGNFHELQDAHSDLMLRNEISRLTTTNDPTKKVLPLMVEILAKLSRADAVIFCLWDEHNQRSIQIVEHKPEEIAIDGTALAASLAETPLLDGKSMVFNEIANMEDLPFAGLNIPLFALLALPLVARRRTIGAGIFIRRQERPFSTQLIQRLQSPLDQIALSLDNKQLLENLELRLSETQALLKLSEIAARHVEFDESMSQILETTENMLGVKAAGILVYDRQENLLIPLKGYGFSDDFYSRRLPANIARSLAAIAFNMGHPQYTNDSSTLSGIEADLAETSGLYNLLAAPLRVQDYPLGVILVANREIPFDSDSARLMMAIGSHIASALRSFDYVVRLRLFRGFSEISRRVSAELVSEQVLVAACQSVVEAIDGVDHAGIVINESRKAGGVVVAEYPLEGAIGRRLVLEGYPVFEQMELTGESIVLNDLPASEDWLGPNYHLMMDIGVQSIMVIPLVVQNQMIGSLGLDARREFHHFTEAEIEFANAIAGQIAVSIRNAQLFEELEARRAELQEANRLKSEFLAKMSHELRTPMNSILGFSEAILTGIYGDLNAKQSNRVQRIIHSGKTLLALIDDLLDISKIDAGRMEMSLDAIDVGAEIKACIAIFEPLSQAKSLELSLDCPPELPRAYADAMRVRQVVNNLLSNAVKFTQEGGVKIEVHARADEIEVAVQDSGIGIEEQHLEIIFDEFRQADGSTTRRFGGTGLGLAITRRLIEMMQGKIWVESTPGQGSRFIFTLPRAAAEELS